jgi:hypothetical protein
MEDKEKESDHKHMSWSVGEKKKKKKKKDDKARGCVVRRRGINEYNRITHYELH